MSDYISSRVKQLRQEREVAKKQSSSASSKSQKSESYVAKRVSEIRAGRENPVKGAGTLAQESEDRVSAANKTSPGGLLPSLLNMLQRSTELQNQTTYRNREIMNEADAGLGQAFANLITPDDPVKALTKAEQSTGLRTVPTAQREQIVQSTLNRDGATDQEIEEAKSRTPEALYNEYNTWLEQGDNRDILSSLINAEQAARRVPSDQVDQYIMDTLLDQGYTVDRVREVQNRRSEYEKSVPFGYDITHRIGSSIEGIGSDAVGSALMALPVFSQALDDILFTGQKTSPDDIDGLAGQIYQLGKSIYGSGQENLQESRLGLNDLQELAYGAFENVGELIALASVSPGLALVEQTVRAAGAGISDMADAGRSSGAAALSALGHGAISYGIERLGISQMMRNMGMRTGMAPAVDAALDRIASLPGLNRLPAALAGTVANAGEEATEEFVQSYADTALDTLLGAPNTPGLLSSDLLNEALQSAAGGAAGGALIGGISSAIGQARTSQRFQPRADEVANNQLTAAIEQAGQAGQMQRAAASIIDETQTESMPQINGQKAVETTQSTRTTPLQEVQTSKTTLTEPTWTTKTNLTEPTWTTKTNWNESLQPKAVDSMLDELAAQSGGRLDASAWGMLASQPQQTAQQESQQTARERYQEQRRAERIAARQAWDETQHQEARLMAENTTMSEAAVNTAVEAMPADVSGEVYALASNSMYQLARQGLTESADEALDLAARSGVRVNQILAAPGGAEALQQVFNQGLMEGLEDSGYGQAGLADAGRAGTAEYADGTLIPEEDRALIDLFAASSDTAVTVRQKLENDAGGYVDTALGQVFFGAEAGADTFGTILHESNHWYNAWDEAGGRKLQTELLKYQAQQMGFENVDALAQQYIEEYQAAGEPLTYAQACEEITSDALRGIFDSEESFARWVNHQQSLAQQNAGQRGTIQKIVDAMRDLLDKVISKAKSILSRSPDNAAAKHAQSLAESQKRALEELYYKHAETAMEAERRARAANENAESVNRNAEFENENAESANDIENSAEDTESKPVQQTAERMKEDVQRYQLPVDQAQMESGQRAAAWENIDREGVAEALAEAFSLSETQRVPIERIQKMARDFLRGEQSKANEITIAKQMQGLLNYMGSENADYNTAIAAAEGIADGIMQRSGRIDKSLWNEYKDLHYFTVSMKRGGPEYQELVYRYGSYALAKKELARFGITVTTAEKQGARGIDQVYQELSEDYPGLFSADTTGSMEQLDRIAEVREAIKPQWVNAYGESYDEAKADLALRIIGRAVSEGVTDTGLSGMIRQRIDQNLNSHRVAVQDRVVKALNAQERQARNEAYKQAQRVVNASAQANRERAAREAQAWARSDARLRTSLARSQDTVQRARDARSADSLRRAIAANRTKLNRMLLHPSDQYHVPPQLMRDALQIAELANASTYNDEAVTKLQALKTQLEASAAADDGVDSVSEDWKNSGISEMLADLSSSMERQRQRSARLTERADTQARRLEQGLNRLYDLQGAQEEWYADYKLGGGKRLDHLTVDQLTTLRDLTSAMVTVIQNSNKLLATETGLAASEFGAEAKREVETSPSRLQDQSGRLAGPRERILEFYNKYRANVYNAERYFNMLGGHRHGGAMEKLGQALSAGEAKQTAIREKGMQIFRDVLDGDRNQKLLKRYSGPDAELIDVGLPVKINRDQMVSLYMHFQNAQNANHILKSGVKIPEMTEYAKGNMEKAFRKDQVYRLRNSENGAPEVIAAIEKELENGEMGEYCKRWIADIKQLANNYSNKIINETSRKISGYEKAKVDNYWKLSVDRDVLQKEVEGVVHNGTIEGRGFLKARKEKAAAPVLLEEASKVAEQILSDAAAYGGLAPAIRDANKIWNANRQEEGSLRAAVRKNFGQDGVSFVENYLADLQQQPRGRKNIFDFLSGLRGRYAGAVLTLNAGVALGQVSGVAAAASDLGWKATWDAYREMLPNSAEHKEAVRKEMMDHGYWQLEAGISQGATAELNAARNRQGKVQQLLSKIPGTDWLENMDTKTRMALWEGSKYFVDHHLEELGLPADAHGSDAWWNAVVNKMTEVNNRTQPNFTVSQQAALQRDPDQLVKMLTMFRSQAFQNYGLVASAVEDLKAQTAYEQEYARQAANPDLEEEERQAARENLDKVLQAKQNASKTLKLAVGGQVISAAIFVAAKMLVNDWLLHGYDREKDEEGRITPFSVAGRAVSMIGENLAGNVYLLSEVWNTIANLFGGGDEEPVSLTGVDAISDFAGDLNRLQAAFTKGEIDPAKVADRLVDLSGSLGNLVGLPVARITKMVEGLTGWGKDLATAVTSDGLTLADILNAPTSSTVQYDNLYTAIFEEPDPDDVASAMEQLRRLDELNPPSKESNAKAGDSKVLSELLKREKEYGGMVQEAAQARLEGNESHQRAVRQKLVNILADALGINKNTKEGQKRLSTVIDKVDNAITGLVKAGLGADSNTGATVYTNLFNEMDAGGDVRSVQDALRKAGFDDDAIKDAVRDQYKQAYLESDDATRRAMETKLARLTDADGEPYFTGEDLQDWVTDYELKGNNDSVYTDLDEALQTKNQAAAQQQINRYMDAGKSSTSIKDRISKIYKETYQAADAAGRQELSRFLLSLRGTDGKQLVSTQTILNWAKG